MNKNTASMVLCALYMLYELNDSLKMVIVTIIIYFNNCSVCIPFQRSVLDFDLLTCSMDYKKKVWHFQKGINMPKQLQFFDILHI